MKPFVRIYLIITAILTCSCQFMGYSIQKIADESIELDSLKRSCLYIKSNAALNIWRAGKGEEMALSQIRKFVGGSNCFSPNEVLLLDDMIGGVQDAYRSKLESFNQIKEISNSTLQYIRQLESDKGIKPSKKTESLETSVNKFESM